MFDPNNPEHGKDALRDLGYPDGPLGEPHRVPSGPARGNLPLGCWLTYQFWRREQRLEPSDADHLRLMRWGGE